MPSSAWAQVSSALGLRAIPTPTISCRLVFLAGVGLSLAAWHLARKQQGYYRSARDRMTAIAAQLGVADLGVATTAGARGESTSRWTKVRTVNEVVLVGLALLNAIGAAFALLE